MQTLFYLDFFQLLTTRERVDKSSENLYNSFKNWRRKHVSSNEIVGGGYSQGGESWLERFESYGKNRR